MMVTMNQSPFVDKKKRQCRKVSAKSTSTIFVSTCVCIILFLTSSNVDGFASTANVRNQQQQQLPHASKSIHPSLTDHGYLRICTSRADSWGITRTALQASTNDVADDTSSKSTQRVVVRNEKCDVAVFGGGFGGLYTALALAKRANSRDGMRRRQSNRPLDIVLVDPSDRFVFLPLLYDLTVGTASEGEVCPTYRSLLEGTGIRHVRGTFEKYNTPDLYSSRIVVPSSTAQSTDDDDSACECIDLAFRASVVAVGATPESVLKATPGAYEYAQPFYTQRDAKATQKLLQRLERQVERAALVRNTGSMEQQQMDGLLPKIAIIGGGYGGVELAACVKRRIPRAYVSLLTRGPPMKNTRAETLVNNALQRLGVVIETCSVDAIEQAQPNESDKSDKKKIISNKGKFIIQRTPFQDEEEDKDKEDGKQSQVQYWDAVLWTAGGRQSQPVCNGIEGLAQVTGSGRLCIDETLRCLWDENAYQESTTKNEDETAPATKSKMKRVGKPPVWALGDSAEIVMQQSSKMNALPKTAQVAMQQSEVVANNILTSKFDRVAVFERSSGIASRSRSPSTSKVEEQVFQFQDLGSMLTLGGPNAALLAPKDDSPFGPIFTPLLDTARFGLRIADQVVSDALTQSTLAKDIGITPVVEDLGLSLSGYGLLGAGGSDSEEGTEDKSLSGTLAGTLTGAARRAIYAARMPTNKQRAYAAASAAVFTAAALAKEASAIASPSSSTQQQKERPVRTQDS